MGRCRANQAPSYQCETPRFRNGGFQHSSGQANLEVFLLPNVAYLALSDSCGHCSRIVAIRDSSRLSLTCDCGHSAAM